MKILVAQYISKHYFMSLLAGGNEISFHQNISDFDLMKEIVDTDILVVRGRKVSEACIEAAQSLKLIVRHGVGVNNIDLDAAEKKNIIIKNTPFASRNAVAELTMFLMLAAKRKTQFFIDGYRDRGIKVREETQGGELNESFLGLIGYGSIARRVEELARGFNMKIYYYDPYCKVDNSNKIANLLELLKMSDIISLHVPLTKGTYHLIGENEMKVMKEDSLLINCSRGEVIDEGALIKAVQRKVIGGAALDVLQGESSEINKDLLYADGFVVTPHIGANTIESKRNMAEETIIIIENFIKKGNLKGEE